MKVTAFVHFSVPYRMAGSETMLHTMLTALADRGHEVSCVTSDMKAPETWEWGPVKGYSMDSLHAGEEKVLDLLPDVVISHHQNSMSAIGIARGIGAKSVIIQHNTFDGNSEVLGAKPDLVVFNTEWVSQMWAAKTERSLVVHPPVWPEEHATTPGDHVTMINMNKDKGALIFYQLARRFPQQKFLAVTGSHGPQLTPENGFRVPRNVEVVPQTTDMKRHVWARTRVLLVPSVYESYGMVAVEAMASGIPVVAAPTPGLKESTGPAGIFCERNQIATWIYQLRRLLGNPDVWGEASAKALARSAELRPDGELKQWVDAVEGL